MTQPDPTNNPTDRREPEVSIDSDCPCLVCQGAMRFIAFRPLPICAPCLYELSDRIDAIQSGDVVMSFDSIGHSQN